MKSLIACASSSLKEVNQDSCQIIRNDKLQLYGVVVADGLGSHSFSEIASNSVTGFLKRQIESMESEINLNFETLFMNAKNNLIEEVKSNIDMDFEALKKTDALSTTVICAIETVNHYLIAYSGNGSAWYIRSSFNQFGEKRYLPWNSINILNPHCIDENGKAALYQYLSINEAQYLPTVMSISKNAYAQGEMIMIATDGIYTYDDVIIGKDEENKVWISGEETMELLYKEISELFKEKPLELTNSDLQFALERYLQEIKSKNIMHDDSTIGLIIPEAVLKYQNDLINKKAELRLSGLQTYSLKNEDNSSK